MGAAVTPDHRRRTAAALTPPHAGDGGRRYDAGMIVAIDGPAGAGKSSIAKAVARHLEFDFLDTGAMYRAATLAVIRHGIDFSDIDAVVRCATRCDIELDGERVVLDGEDVSDSIRTPTVTSAIVHIADRPEIRRVMTERQRAFADARDIVTEGRDQGTEVFPNAECKIFLTASPLERARRRHRQLLGSGRPQSLEEVLAAQNQRDAEDARRPVGSLRPADDAVTLLTDGMDHDQVVDAALKIVEERRQQIAV